VKKSALAAGLKAAAGHQQPAAAGSNKRDKEAHKPPKTVLIGGHFAPEVRRTLLLVQAEPENMGKNLKQLLGEAINDLCAKYGKPQPYSGEE
jgi:Antitoxin-like ribbon-helix-helix